MATATASRPTKTKQNQEAQAPAVTEAVETKPEAIQEESAEVKDSSEQATEAFNKAADEEAEPSEVNDSTEGTNSDTEPSIKLPENEFSFLQEILKTPIGDGQYEISKEAPKLAFKGRGSPKTLAQTAKNKLIERGIIESIQKGGAQSRAIVKLLVDEKEITMSNEGRGRKVSSRRTNRTLSATATRSERTSRGEGSAPARGRSTSLSSIFTKMRNQYEDLNAFQNELSALENKYPNSFSNLIKTLRSNAA
jgi:hypothetical protein